MYCSGGGYGLKPVFKKISELLATSLDMKSFVVPDFYFCGFRCWDVLPHSLSFLEFSFLVLCSKINV